MGAHDSEDADEFVVQTIIHPTTTYCQYTWSDLEDYSDMSYKAN